MPELDLITEIHTDVKHLIKMREDDKKALEDHIKKDEETQEKESAFKRDYFAPLWNAHQRRIGARASMAALYTALSAGAALAVEWFHK